MKNENYIINLIEDIKQILQKNQYIKTRYEHDIEWFSNTEKQVSNNIVRVALMGITSSGKSTLINAILGERLLPIAVKPSSSIITTCSKSEKRRATIYFRDKEPLVIEGEELNHITIKKYADETENPNNVLNVSQIDINTPNFLFDENIHIIDSPGLDACDLEIHEKITMEILLPTIDICVFVTTVKASSDGINSEKIKIVDEKQKEIILVQNMIDSVEERIGKNGVVEASKFELLEKYKKTAQRLLRKGTNNRNSEVVQISALNAFNGIVSKDTILYKSSNIEGFLKKIQTCVDNVMPKINKQRESSIIGKINNIISTDKKLSDLNDEEEIKVSDTMLITKKDINDIFQEFKMSKGNILSKIEQLDDIIVNIVKEINNIDSKEDDNYLEIIKRANLENSKIEKEILDVVKNCEAKKNEFYKKLNLDIRYIYSFPSVTYQSIDVVHKYEEKKEMIEKEGLFNKGKRILASMFDTRWGYAEKIVDEKIVDKMNTIIELQNVCDVNRVKYVNTIREWSKQYIRSINLFYNEVNKKEEEFLDKRDQDINEKDIEFVKEKLIEVRDKLLKNEIEKDGDSKKSKINLKKESDNADDDNLESLKNNINSLIKNRTYNTYKMANHVIEENYKVVGKYVHEKTDNVLGENSIDIFWTWDIDKCVSFINRILNVYLNSEEINSIKKSGVYKHDDFIIVYESGDNKTKIVDIMKEYSNGNYNLYIIFNGIQIGNAQKQIIKNTTLNEFVINNNVVINMVIDSSKEFVNGNNIRELLIEVNMLVYKITQTLISGKIGYLLINSKNPIYNLALIECQETLLFKIADYRDIKEKLFSNILSRGKEEKEFLEDILRYFLDCGTIHRLI